MPYRIALKGCGVVVGAALLYTGCGRSSEDSGLGEGPAIVDGGGTTGGGGTGASSGTGGGIVGPGGNSGSGGSYGTGGSGGGAIDCSTVGCGPPPLCSSGCGEPCGCCPCGEGEVQGGLVCSGGCWAEIADAGVVDSGIVDSGVVDANVSNPEGGTIDCSAVGCSPPPLCDTGCTAPCGCCPCADGTSQGAYICVGGCWALTPDGGTNPCQTDADCASGYYCRSTTNGNDCVPFAQEGDSCGGAGARAQVQCAPNLICTDYPPLLADAPGVCRLPCAGNRDCDPGSYCSSTNDVCRADGTCFGDVDCDARGNTYARAGCAGSGICTAGTCSWVCR